MQDMCGTSGEPVHMCISHRSPQYNSVRLGFTVVIALCFGAFYWAVRTHRMNAQCLVFVLP